MNPRALFAAAALMAIASAALSQAAPGESRLDAVIESGTLRVCTTGDYKPYTYQDADGGYYRASTSTWPARWRTALGVKAECVPTTWKTLLPDFSPDKCDIAMGGISVTLERQKQAFFSEPTCVNGKAPIARCEDEAKFQTIEDIDQPGVTVIVNPRRHQREASCATTSTRRQSRSSPTTSPSSSRCSMERPT